MIRIGFLPLYVKLYDERCPEAAAKARVYAKQMEESLRAHNLDVVAAPVCRLEPEFADAVRLFERSGCEAILTLHLAYSPSLESVNPLAGTELPIVILDTTFDRAFTKPEEQLMENHGIHGVQDFGNLLVRRGKPFLITAGAWDEPLLNKAASLLRSAAMSYKMNHVRVGRIGGEFPGMGDFRFDPESVGLTEVAWTPQPEVSEDAVKAEAAQDLAAYDVREITPECHLASVRTGLKVRSWIEKEKLDAFTMNFPGVSTKTGWETVPFLECSKSMARGVGYAGEGDVLTAGLHAALFRGFKECSFAEMFCPDWQGNRIFTSHMGEINLALAANKPLLAEMDYVFGDAANPAVAYACFKTGKAMWVDLAPLADGKFRLIASNIEFLEQPADTRWQNRNAGWFRPQNGTIGEFLERYTRLGGTHHAVVIYNGEADVLRDFAYMMKWEFVLI